MLPSPPHLGDPRNANALTSPFTAVAERFSPDTGTSMNASDSCALVGPVSAQTAARVRMSLFMAVAPWGCGQPGRQTGPPAARTGLRHSGGRNAHVALRRLAACTTLLRARIWLTRVDVAPHQGMM